MPLPVPTTPRASARHTRARRAPALRLGLALCGLLACAALPVAACADGGLDLYGTSYADDATSSIFKVNVNGSAPPTVTTVYQFDSTVQPDGLLFDRQGNIIFSDDANLGPIHRLDLSAPGGPADTVIGYTHTPGDLALTPDGQTVLVSDFFSSSITRIRLDGSLAQSSWNLPNKTWADGLAFDAAGSLFANLHTDTASYLAQLNPNDGAILKEIAVPDRLDGLTYDSFTGKLFAATAATTNGSHPGVYAFDVATLFSADSAISFLDFANPAAGTVVFDPAILAALGGSQQPAYDPYGIGGLDGITADGAGHLFIAGPTKNRVYQYDLDTKVLSIVASVSQVDDLAPAAGLGSLPTRAPDAAPVPEGSALLLWGVGVLPFLGLMRGRRRPEKA